MARRENRVERAHLAVAAIALIFVGCGGGGGSAEPAPPDDSSAPPPPPSSGGPSGPAENRQPLADAGPDRMTVEEQDVVVDGSRTQDPDNDPITYGWELVSVPAGSHVGVTATSPTFNFRPDLPGQYELRLTANDGRTSSTDTVRVTAEALITIVSGPRDFRIQTDSAPGSEQITIGLKTSGHYGGGQVTLEPASSVPWLTLPATLTTAPPGETVQMPVRLNPAHMGPLENGKHTASVTVKPRGGWEALPTQLSLELTLPVVHAVVPYVAYAGVSSRVTLYGEHLSKADGRSLFVNGVEALEIEATGDTRAQIDLPPLSEGTFKVRVGNALDIPREMARVLVRSPPEYATADVPLPGLIHQVEYDAERDSLYALFRAPNIPGAPVYLARRLRHAGGMWHVETIEVPGQPRALTLTADGTRLLVTSGGCAVHELDPGTLAVLRSLTKPSCNAAFEPLGSIAALADGRVLVVDDDRDSTVWEYPAFTPTNALPEASLPFTQLNYERNRLLWAELPEERGFWRAWYYDIHAGARAWTGQSGYWRHILGMSGDGSRTLHRADLYDREMRLLGTMGGLTNSFEVAPALDRRGTRAVVLDDHGNQLVINDLTGPGPIYPAIAAISLPGNVTATSMVLVAPTDRTAFVLAGSRTIPSIFWPVDVFTLFVRNLP